MQRYTLAGRDAVCRDSGLISGSGFFFCAKGARHRKPNIWSTERNAMKQNEPVGLGSITEENGLAAASFSVAEEQEGFAGSLTNRMAEGLYAV